MFLIIITDVYGLVELMRTSTSRGTSSYTDTIMTSISRTVKAGRYLASRCQVLEKNIDVNLNVINTFFWKERLEKNFQCMQKSLDDDYPQTYQLVVYFKEMNGIYKTIFNGTRDNDIPIRIICIKISEMYLDFFGFLGDENELADVLNAPVV